MTKDTELHSEYCKNTAELDSLIRKYSVSVPRYTSYPTAVEFSEEINAQCWKNELEKEFSKQESTAQPLSLYVHIPFCDSLCYFCACNKSISRDKSEALPYLDALASELESYRRIIPGIIPVEQLHWGGGTPNFLSPESIRHLYGLLQNAFGPFTKTAEISIETDPRTLTEEHLSALAELGFNRLSMGVQDFTPEVQKTINRIQSFELTRDISEQARALGFKGLNIDLVYGLPQQTLEGFSKTIDQILKIRPERIAMYGYAHVTWKKKIQKVLEDSHLPSPAERIALFIRGLQKLTQAGYRYIGMDHFALPEDSLSQALDSGHLNRNFMGYTTHKGSRLLAFGSSSISILPTAICQNEKTVEAYEERALRGEFPTKRGLIRDEEDQLRAEIIETLLCQGEVDFDAVEQHWGISFHDKFGTALDKLKPMVDDGLIEFGESSLSLTPLGRLFARNAATVFDTYLKKHQAQEKPVFSQAV